MSREPVPQDSEAVDVLEGVRLAVRDLRYLASVRQDIAKQVKSTLGGGIMSSSISIAATVLYAGAAPGIVTGVTQFNVLLGTPGFADGFFVTVNGTFLGSFRQVVAVGPN